MFFLDLTLMFHWENHGCFPYFYLILLCLTTTYVPFIMFLEPLLMFHLSCMRFPFYLTCSLGFLPIQQHPPHSMSPPFTPWSPRCKGQDFQEMWQQKDVTLTDCHRTTPRCGRVCWRLGKGGMRCVWKIGERGKLEVSGWEVDVTMSCSTPKVYMAVSLNGGTPQNTPKWSFLVGKPMVVGYHHFRNPPHVAAKNCRKTHLFCKAIIFSG